MKKLILILPLLLLNACTIVTQEIKNHESVSQEENRKASLSEIKKEAKDYLTELKDKEDQNTLTKEDKEAIAFLKNWQDEKDFFPLIKYSEREITPEDLLTLIWALEEGFTLEEVNNYLKLGLYTKNPYCEYEYSKYKIFQVLPEYVLANGCNSSADTYCFGKIVAILKEENELYFDSKFLTPQNEQCATFIGIHQYESKDGNYHTVPILKFLPKNIDKSVLALVEESRKANK